MESYVCRNRHHGNNGTRTYNELATIMHVTGEDAVRWGAAPHSLTLRLHRTQGRNRSVTLIERCSDGVEDQGAEEAL